ncbi:MAG: Na+/H+ antiporter NhaA [Desulfobacterales bacterium]|jgi:NhaA family Na+:H+ antiporter
MDLAGTSTDASEQEDSGNGKDYKPSQWFFNKEVLSSMLLMAASVAAVVIANSSLSHHYEHWLHFEISIFFGQLKISHSLLHWINDGLMALFFFTVGLEIKREVMVGELASPKLAMLPVIAAGGGMIVPGVIYAALNWGQPGMAGWGIPVATDIAFSLGAIALLGKKLPVGLRIFLTAFAIADDLGAVLIIALFYTKNIAVPYLIASAVCLLILLIANLMWVRWLPFYIVMGVAMWICVMGSGVHATVAGVVVAMLVPARGKYNPIRFVKKVQGIVDNMKMDRYVDNFWYSIFIKPEHLNSVHALSLACQNLETPLQRLEHALHPWVVFAILPLFAFFNAGLSLHDISFASAIAEPIALGCILGLVFGKPIGITLASFWAVKTGIAALPENVRWAHIAGAGMLGGIGFTMSLFISGLSFVDPHYLNFSKLGVLSGSILSALGGLLFLAVVAAREGKVYQEGEPAVS